MSYNVLLRYGTIDSEYPIEEEFDCFNEAVEKSILQYFLFAEITAKARNNPSITLMDIILIKPKKGYEDKKTLMERIKYIYMFIY